MFGIGGLTGIPLAFNSVDLYLHDTYYIIAHFHYIVAPGTIFAIFAGIYYWFPKATGRMMNEFWGKVHFWASMICMNCIFFPMFLQGMAGMHRRWFDGGRDLRSLNKPVLHWNSTIVACGVGDGAVPDSVHLQFLLEHLAREEGGRESVGRDHARMGRAVAAAARELHRAGRGYRGPYEYSVPGTSGDFIPQSDPQGPRPTPERTDTDMKNPKSEIRNPKDWARTRIPERFAGVTRFISNFGFRISDFISSWKFPYTVSARPDTGLYNAKSASGCSWRRKSCSLAGYFPAYVFLRVGADAGLLAARVAECSGGHDEYGVLIAPR